MPVLVGECVGLDVLVCVEIIAAIGDEGSTAEVPMECVETLGTETGIGGRGREVPDRIPLSVARNGILGSSLAGLSTTSSDMGCATVLSSTDSDLISGI